MARLAVRFALALCLSLVATSAAEAAYVAEITSAHAKIQAKCGGFTDYKQDDYHSDLFLTNGQYCNCYEYLWNQRDTYPFNALQVIYHEAASCQNGAHIHLQKKNLNGRIHYCVDQSSDADGACYANATNTCDRVKNSSGGLIYNSRRQVCHDGHSISFQAESYYTKIARSGHYWDFRSWPEKPGLSGTGGMQAFPKNPHKNINSGYVNSSPEMRYWVNFHQTGTFYIWIHGWGESGKEDSVHAGVNLQTQSSADRISGCGWSWAGWKWCRSTMDGSPATVWIGWTGYRNFSLYMRENGFRADRIVLSRDPNFVPWH